MLKVVCIGFSEVDAVHRICYKIFRFFLGKKPLLTIFSYENMFTTT